MSDAVAENEIDLKELIRAVLATKKWVLVAVILMSLAYWTLQTVKNIAKPTLTTFETRVNLVFSGVASGRYPNGSSYSNTDLIAPAVLNEVFDQNDVKAFISRKIFIGAFSVEPYMPDRAFILAKYSDQLKSKNPTVAEINALQEQMRKELDGASNNAITLRFSSARAGKLPEALVRKLMSDVPKEWARHMIEDIGVAQFDAEIYSSKVVNTSLFKSIDYLIAFEMLLERLDFLQSNVDVLKSLPNGLVVSDDETGMTVPDLEKAVNDVKRYRIAPLIHPVRSLGIAKNPQTVKLYFENELIELNRNVSTLQNKRQNVEDAFTSYVSSSQTTYRSTTSNENQRGLGPSLETNFLDKLVELTDSGADIKYRQKLNAEMLTISNSVSETVSEINRIQSILSSMEGENSVTQKLRENYSSQVNSDMPMIVERLKSQFDVSTRIYDKLSRTNLGSSGLMYRLTDGEVLESQSGNILTASNLRLYFILIFLVIVLVVPVVMIRNTIRK